MPYWLFAGLAFFCLTAHAELENGGRRGAAANLSELGLEAYRGGNYEQAINFFSRAKKTAANAEELQQAYERLISAYLRAFRAADARRELDEYAAAQPDRGSDRRTVFGADLLLLEHKYREAEDILEQMLGKRIISGQLYFHLLSSLGYAQRMQNKWEEAAETYRVLETAGSGQDWEFTGFCNRIFCLIMNGKFIESTKLLSDTAKFKGNSNYLNIDILKVLQQLEEKKFDEALKNYQVLRPSLPQGGNPLLYITQMNAAQCYLDRKQPGPAIDFLLDALRSASSKDDRRVAMRNLINAYFEDGKLEAAATNATKYLEFYPDAPDVFDVKMKVSGLFASLKKYNNAREVLADVIKGTKFQMKQRLAAARQAAAVCEAQEDYVSAAEFYQFIQNNGLDNNQRREGSYLQGMALLKNKNYEQALSTFSQNAAVESEWQGAAMVGMMQTQIEMKKYQDAYDTAKKITLQIENNHNIAQAMYFTGYILQLMGRDVEAARAYQVFVEKFPDSQYAAQAYFEAGNLYYQNRDYESAVKMYGRLAAGLPKHELTPAALYRTVYANFHLNRIGDAMATVGVLKKNYLLSPYTPGALFWQVDYLRNQQQVDEAIIILEEMAKIYQGNQEVLGRVLLDRAILAETAEQGKEAIAILDDFYARFATDPRMSEALFLGGDIASRNTDYGKAIQYYSRCAQLRPDSELARAANGRVGDCYYALYGKTSDTKHLREAVTVFNKLLEEKKLNGDMYNQTLFKLGLCMERLKDEALALQYFNEVLYRYGVAVKRGLKPDAVWGIKAGYAASRILVHRNTPEDAAAALKIFHLMEEMKLVTVNGEFSAMIAHLKAKYQI